MNNEETMTFKLKSKFDTKKRKTNFLLQLAEVLAKMEHGHDDIDTTFNNVVGIVVKE